MSKRLCGVNQNWISAELAAVNFRLIVTANSFTRIITLCRARQPLWRVTILRSSISAIRHSSCLEYLAFLGNNRKKLQALSRNWLGRISWTMEGETQLNSLSRVVFLKQLNFLVFIRRFRESVSRKREENENREKRNGKEKLLTFFEAESRFRRACTHCHCFEPLFIAQNVAARRRGASDFNCHGEEVNRIINYISYVCNYTSLLLCC